MMKYVFSLTFSLVVTLLGLSSCRTSGDVAQSKEYADPTEVKTENEVESTAPKKEPAHIEELQRQLAILQGENESLKMTHQRELAVMAQKISELEEENRK